MLETAMLERAMMNITEETAPEGFERVVHCHDEASGLKAIIAVHSTRLGPAAGGCRMFPYESLEAARHDVLRLARGMTFKNAAAGLELGGGKAVIIADPKTEKTPDLMRAFGRFVNHLEGSYYTAEDVGISVTDIQYAAEETPYAAGLTSGEFASGDPSPFTARGVYLSLREALKLKTGTADLNGIRVAVQGLGNVGMSYAGMLHEAGADLTVTDINRDELAEAQDRFGAAMTNPGQIHLADVDVFAPCAMGGALSKPVIDSLKATIVCGAANNQLADETCGARLHERGILYAPDYVVNSGGIINVASEIFQVTDWGWVNRKIDGLAEFTGQILSQAMAADRPPHEIADELVRQRLKAARDNRKSTNRALSPSSL